MSEHTRSGAGDRLASQLAGALGPQAVTAAGEGLVVRPVDEGGVTEALRVIGAGWLDAAGDEGTRPRLAIRGRGSKAAWGDLPAAPGVILDTTALRTGLRHDAGDLVASAPAGMGWAELQDQLGQAGQWIPLDPPLAGDASVGGVVAAATSGPRRVAYGAVRDLVIGARAVLPGGRAVQAGGRVIKNVAGYDLCKLLVGSFGSLAVITEVTFKVLPVPQCRGSVTADFHDPTPAHRAALDVLASALQPAAVQMLWTEDRVHVRVDVDGHEAVVARQLRDLRELLARPGGAAPAGRAGAFRSAAGIQVEGPLPVTGHRDLLGAMESAPNPPGAAIVRLGMPASALLRAWPAFQRHLDPLDGRPLRADVAAGLMWWVVPGPAGGEAARLAEAVARLNAALRSLRGYATLESGPAEAHRRLAGCDAGSLALSRRIKGVFDPQNLLVSPRLGL